MQCNAMQVTLAELCHMFDVRTHVVHDPLLGQIDFEHDHRITLCMAKMFSDGAG